MLTIAFFYLTTIQCLSDGSDKKENRTQHWETLHSEEQDVCKGMLSRRVANNSKMFAAFCESISRHVFCTGCWLDLKNNQAQNLAKNRSLHFAPHVNPQSPQTHQMDIAALYSCSNQAAMAISCTNIQLLFWQAMIGLKSKKPTRGGGAQRRCIETWRQSVSSCRVIMMGHRMWLSQTKSKSKPVFYRFIPTLHHCAEGSFDGW